MEKTIAAISTANGVGGLGVIRISGEKAIETAKWYKNLFLVFHISVNSLSFS